jgi:hypothetical protein
MDLVPLDVERAGPTYQFRLGRANCKLRKYMYQGGNAEESPERAWSHTLV